MLDAYLRKPKVFMVPPQLLVVTGWMLLLLHRNREPGSLALLDNAAEQNALELALDLELEVRPLPA
jgi:hypothetical protein